MYFYYLHLSRCIYPRDAFILHCLRAANATRYRLYLNNIKLYAKMIDVQPVLNVTIHNALEKQPTTYAVHKTKVKAQFISAGCTEFGYNCFSSTIPRRITIALIDHAAFDGSFTYSPFNFNHIDCAQSHFMLAGIFIPRFHITSTFLTHIQRAHVSTCIRFASCECNLPALESEGANFNS